MLLKHQKVNRILFAAPKSGIGKTLFTCGFLNLMKQRGMDVTSFKCGPDYIDPMFHKKVLGIYGGNLDTFFCNHRKVAGIVGSCGHEYAVVEGVMGIYDGLGGLMLEASSYDVACAADIPIILLIDAYGTGRTIISQIKGILADDDKKLIKGIILNRTSAGFYERLAREINSSLKQSGYQAEVIGFLPVLKEISIDSRHLGLLRPDEIENIREQIDIISRSIEENCDVDAIIRIMKAAPGLVCEKEIRPVDNAANSLKIAVAMDEAFCFYYRENIELLKSLGVEPVFFSPIHDSALPDGISGLYIGGGYPELYLDELEGNLRMRESVKNAIEAGIPSIAECGGFMYLHRQIYDTEGRPHEMAGVIDGCCRKKEHLVRFGYVEMEPCGKKSTALGDAMQGIKGHEFHYFDSDNNGSDINVKKPGTDKKWEGIHVGADHVWGFPHLYFESNETFAREFVEVMKNGSE